MSMTPESQHPTFGAIKNRVQAWSVLSLLAVGGLAFSAAAIALLIGASDTQIAAGTGGSTDLFRYPWFLAGLALAAIGVIWGVLAVVAARMQSTDRKEPSLSIEVGGNMYELDTDSKSYTKLSVRVRNVSHVALYDVRLLLLGGNPVTATYYLRAEHDELEPFSRSINGSICPVGESLFFQVAETTSGSEEVSLQYAHERLPGSHKIPIPIDRHSTFVMLRAEGRRVDNNGVVFARADVELFVVTSGPGGLRLRKRDVALKGMR